QPRDASAQGAGAAAPAGNASPELQKLVNELERLDKQIATAKSETEQARLNATRADLLEKIIGVATAAEDRNLWTRQYTETISAAIQTGGFPDGIKRLQTLLTTLSR